MQKDRHFDLSYPHEPDHMTGESKAFAPPFKGRNSGSPLENPHRVKKTFEIATQGGRLCVTRR
jgi:hypothetical protein